MKKLIAIVAFALSFLAMHVANASGEIIRQGPVVVIKADCLAFNLDTISQKLPEGRTTVAQLVLIAAASIRDLTPEERALCTGQPVVAKQWRVHDNGNITRPVYTLSNGVLLKHKTERATIGEQCGALAIKPARVTRLEYRYLVRDKVLVAICDFN